jgi:hypothetical protein
MAPLLAEIRFYVVHAMYWWKSGVAQMTICTITVKNQSHRCVALTTSKFLNPSVVLHNQVIVKPRPLCNWALQQASYLEVFVSII